KSHQEPPDGGCLETIGIVFNRGFEPFAQVLDAKVQLEKAARKTDIKVANGRASKFNRTGRDCHKFKANARLRPNRLARGKQLAGKLAKRNSNVLKRGVKNLLQILEKLAQRSGRPDGKPEIHCSGKAAN